MWYQPTKKKIYFITGMSRRGEDFSHFLDQPPDIAGEGKITYTYKYVSEDITSLVPSRFLVVGWIYMQSM